MSLIQQQHQSFQMTPIVSFGDNEKASADYMQLLLRFGPDFGPADLHLIELLRGVFYYRTDVIIAALTASAQYKNDLATWDPLLCRVNEVINLSPDKEILRHKLLAISPAPRRDNMQHQINKR